jgi:DNA-binding transcriptional LysR family regulator
MNKIDLRHFDLNLLVVFDVLMMERSVTVAADRLGRTQSAVSHSLSRLREQFGDRLLVKAGLRMQPTAFALELIEQARPMLNGIQRVLSPAHLFDPSTSNRVFRVAAPDFMLTLFANLLSSLRAEAPSVAVEWTSPRAPTLLDIAEGLIDFAIVPAQLRLPQGVAGEAVGALGWRCFGRKKHQAFSDWGPEMWARWPHLVVRIGDDLTSPVNVAAKTAGLERTIAGWVPHFSAIAPILAGSDMLATLPEIAMSETLHAYNLDSMEVPFPIAPLPHSLVWCVGREREPGIGWLRDRLRPLVKNSFAR